MALYRTEIVPPSLTWMFEQKLLNHSASAIILCSFYESVGPCGAAISTRFPALATGTTRLLVLDRFRCNEILGQRWDDFNFEFREVRPPRDVLEQPRDTPKADLGATFLADERASVSCRPYSLRSRRFSHSAWP